MIEQSEALKGEREEQIELIKGTIVTTGQIVRNGTFKISKFL